MTRESSFATLPALVLLVFISAIPLAAQEPVVKWADGFSWGTAIINPVWGVIEAARGERPGCHLAQLAISGAVAIPTAFVLQHVVVSPRPCCAGNGMPSAHATIGMIGLAQPSPGRTFTLRMTIGFASAGTTAGLRQVANRHTAAQVLAGLALGAGGEVAGQLIRCD